MTTSSSLPLILAGPILRHCDRDHFTLWWVSSKPLSPQLTLKLSHKSAPLPLNEEQVHRVQLGKHAWQYLLHLEVPGLLPQGQAIGYSLEDADGQSLFADIEGLCYPDKSSPELVLQPRLDRLLHGSCRNPHHHSGDALVAADTLLEQNNAPGERPALLMLSGDQLYVDDVAGPTLVAIAQVIELLGLKQESFSDAPLKDSAQIDYGPDSLYQRPKQLLPRTQYPAKTGLWRWYINHPIFTSSMAENHLLSFAEVTALYLLIWSPELWQQLELPQQLPGLTGKRAQEWQTQWQHLLEFKAGLGKVRRLLAHLPTYMIFDDHDITDDWNLTARWEEAAYGHAFSKRIIGNALLGYTLFQALGNQPKRFTDFFEELSGLYLADSERQDALIDKLLKCENWHYTLDTQPRMVVLDTRTRRWRSESNLAKPSGLMDWEALMDLQQALLGQDKVIIVSAAPIFGVKLIEAVQRTATLIGASLLVDAENWMAHPGAANALLSIFMHRRTPQEFVILSGDVHYSFAYDIGIRFRRASPNIYQVTASGIKNQFPEKLLPVFDKLNGWLYGHFSPLNLLTKRKRMSIRGRRPNGAPSKRLVNQSGIGLLELAENGAPKRIAVLHADMSLTEFQAPKDSRD
ncbi:MULTISPECIES: alkaline phosphatase D family protein [Shewanella]|uniref:alkaline phosphatase D family protein n=1 Tax=Shewanella TaxID=22 RepID=UPI0020442EA8|nr:alkaline phosphatase D family protein [Shewanella indica]